MRDLRNSTALRQLSDLGTDPGPSPWAWAVVRVDPKGRVVLPADARIALGAPPGRQTSVHGICHRVALVLSPDDAGAEMGIDTRGRLGLPAWLRRGPATAMVVGTRGDRPLVVVAPASVLDAVGDLLTGSSS